MITTRFFSPSSTVIRVILIAWVVVNILVANSCLAAETNAEQPSNIGTTIQKKLDDIVEYGKEHGGLAGAVGWAIEKIRGFLSSTDENTGSPEQQKQDTKNAANQEGTVLAQPSLRLLGSFLSPLIAKPGDYVEAKLVYSLGAAEQPLTLLETRVLDHAGTEIGINQREQNREPGEYESVYRFKLPEATLAGEYTIITKLELAKSAIKEQTSRLTFVVVKP